MPVINPLTAVDNLRFGMSKEEIDRDLGLPTMVRRTPLGETSETRTPTLPRVTIADKRLVELSYLPVAGPLLLGERDLFLENRLETLRIIQASYGPLEIHVGFVVSRTAGLALSGFHDGDVAQTAVTVFPEGRWDRFLPQLKRFVLR